MASTRRQTCRVCNQHALVDCLSLGCLAVSTFSDHPARGLSAPLTLALCSTDKGGCGLVQLAHDGVDPDVLYRTYWYRSGVNATMRAELLKIIDDVESKKQLVSGDVVLDIGANDGTLLRAYKTAGLLRIGFEPARNLTEEARTGGNVIIPEYFSARQFREHTGPKKAAVISTIAMFYDLENPHTFVQDIASILAPDGIWINQLSYLPSMLATNAFDNICHEHIEYYSLSTLERLLAAHRLRVIDAELNETNGGSIRVTIGHDGYELPDRAAKARVHKLTQQEARHSLDKISTYEDFASRIQECVQTVQSLITRMAKNGQTVMVYGASTKGNTYLQYAKLDSRLLTAACERNSSKWGRYTIRTKIPIISETAMRAAKPDCLLVLPWHFREEFIAREEEYLQQGGRLLFPLPKPVMVYMHKGRVVEEKL